MTFLKLFLNAMIKIDNIFDIIENSKSMEHTNCTHQKKCMKIFIQVFPTIFQICWV
jgi:hypothetical protein